MKKKVLYAVLIIILIIDIVITFTKGLNVSLNYSEGYLITFTEKTDINIDDVKTIVKDIWGKDYLVQNVEFFSDSVSIKVKEYDDEKIESLKSKVNEKFSSELTTTDFKIEHIPNTKIRSLAEPYIIPVGLSILLVLLFYAIRYKGTKQMIKLIINIVILGIIIYSLHAIARLQVNPFSIALSISAGLLVVLLSTYKFENEAK